jgi:hypothetical protein
VRATLDALDVGAQGLERRGQCHSPHGHAVHSDDRGQIEDVAHRADNGYAGPAATAPDGGLKIAARGKKT